MLTINYSHKLKHFTKQKRELICCVYVIQNFLSDIKFINSLNYVSNKNHSDREECILIIFVFYIYMQKLLSVFKPKELSIIPHNLPKILFVGNITLLIQNQRQ